MTEFLHMGGYATFVWTSYGLAAVVLIANIIAPALRRRRLERDIAGALRRARREAK